MYERDKSRFRVFTEELLNAGKRHERVRNATHAFCAAIVRVSVSPAHRFDEAQSTLISSVFALDRAIRGSLHPDAQRAVLKAAPSFMSDLRCAHETRLRIVCGGVAQHAETVSRTSSHAAKA